MTKLNDVKMAANIFDSRDYKTYKVFANWLTDNLGIDWSYYDGYHQGEIMDAIQDVILAIEEDDMS